MVAALPGQQRGTIVLLVTYPKSPSAKH
jgi:hypothetical protein